MNWQECVPYFCLSEYDCKVYTTGPSDKIGSVFYEFYDESVLIAMSQISFNYETQKFGIDKIWVHEDYRNMNIGRKMAAAYYDVAIHGDMVTENIRTTTTLNPDGPGSEPWLNCIGPEVNLLDQNDPYVVWQNQFRESQNSN